MFPAGEAAPREKAEREGALCSARFGQGVRAVCMPFGIPEGPQSQGQTQTPEGQRVT